VTPQHLPRRRRLGRWGSVQVEPKALLLLLLLVPWE
jgi:hypothetical protein